MYKEIPKKFDYSVKEIFDKKVKIIQNCCNRLDMSCCGGGSSCCKSLFLHITNICNANCHFCIADKNKSEIENFEKLYSVIDELTSKGIISKVVLTGGEPLLHSNFVSFLNMLDTFKLRYYSLNTNGILLYDFIDEINNSKLKHVNISMHHYNDMTNLRIMKNALTWGQIKELRSLINDDIELRTACTITEDMKTEYDIMKFIETSKSNGVENVIFRNEYREFNKHLEEFQKIWNNLFTADICNCGYKLINGVNAEYRESNIKLKQEICEADAYMRDFIYKDDDMLSGSWEYGSQELF